MFFWLLCLEELANGIERCRLGGEAKCIEHGDHAAGGFGERRVIEEEGLPDDVGARWFVQREILAGRDGVEAEELGFEVVIREKFVDAPQPEVAEFRGEEVGVDVDEFGGVENLVDQVIL